MPEDVERMSVTLPPDLFAELDAIVDAGEYDSRSEATREVLRAFSTGFNRTRNRSGLMSGTVVVRYNHEHGDVTDEKNAVQHEFGDIIIAVHHVHLGDHLCPESIAVDGSGERIEQMFARLRPVKGVHQTKLTVVEAEGKLMSGRDSTSPASDVLYPAAGYFSIVEDSYLLTYDVVRTEIRRRS